MLVTQVAEHQILIIQLIGDGQKLKKNSHINCLELLAIKRGSESIFTITV